MKKIRIITISVWIAAILLIMGGCAEMNAIEKTYMQGIEDEKDILLAHMEEKYNVKFLPISYSAEGDVTNQEFRCYADGTDPERDYVSVFVREENGEKVIVDDYFGILIRDDYQRRVEAISDAVAGDTKAFVYRYAVSFFDNSLAGDNTIDDAIASGERINATKYVFVEVLPGSEEEFEEICDRITQKLEDARLPGIVLFFGLAQGELDNIGVNNYLTYLPSMIRPDGTVCLMMAERLVSVD